MDVICEGMPNETMSFAEFVECVSRYRANHAATISAVSGLRTLSRINLAYIIERLAVIEDAVVTQQGAAATGEVPKPCDHGDARYNHILRLDHAHRDHGAGLGRDHLVEKLLKTRNAPTTRNT